jgi:hypothetical protein
LLLYQAAAEQQSKAPQGQMVHGHHIASTQQPIDEREMSSAFSTSATMLRRNHLSAIEEDGCGWGY